MTLPIIFVHTGNSWYLKYTLRQAKYYNPSSPIYLLGDDRNNLYPFITHINISQYGNCYLEFKEVYQHKSTNDYDYELLCFARWFYIRELVRDKKIDSFIYLDSDVLCFEDFANIENVLNKFEIANTGEGIGMPAFTYFKNYSTIDSVCQYFIKSYKDASMLQRIRTWYNSFLDQESVGGICDMTLFDFFFQEGLVQSGKLDLVGQLAVDPYLSDTKTFEEKNGYKNIIWKNKQPFCKLLITGNKIRFITLHYQGAAKKLIPYHYNGDEMLVIQMLDIFRDKKQNLLNFVRRFAKRLIN